jgi:hypothetical protein
MPNGKYEPQCFNCSFYIATGTRQCKKHEFSLPDLLMHIICRDWQLDDRCKNDIAYKYVPDFIQKREFRELERGKLYGYESNLSSYIELGFFKTFKNFIFEEKVLSDPEFESAIYLRSNHYSLLPEVGHHVKILINDDEVDFEVFETERNVWKNMNLGSSEVSYEKQKVRMLICRERTDILYNWMANYLNMRTLLAGVDKRKSEIALRAWGLSVFIEVIEKLQSYKLHPNSLNYKYYDVQGKSM